MRHVFEVILMIFVLLILIALAPILFPIVVWFAVFGSAAGEPYTKVNETWTPTDLANSRT